MSFTSAIFSFPINVYSSNNVPLGISYQRLKASYKNYKKEVILPQAFPSP